MDDELYEADENILNIELLINDQTIKAIVTMEIVLSNPDPNRYKSVNMKFVHKPDSIQMQIANSLKAFEFKNDLETEKSNDYYGPIKIISEDVIYIGQMNSNYEREGRGVQFLSDGSLYEGYFANDSTCRMGRIIFQGGEIYNGEFTNNSLNGYGVYQNVDGSKYTGYFVDDIREGEGLEEWNDGSNYRGMYSQSSKNGAGVFTFKNGDTYKGNFVDDHFNGEGTQKIEKDQKQYIGIWLNGNLQSPGVIKYANDNQYNGEIKDMMKEGNGEFQNHAVTFVGVWVNNMMQGTFILKQNGEQDKMAKYEKGQFIEWIGNNSSKNKILNSSEEKGIKDEKVKVESSGEQAKKKKVCPCC